MEGIITVPMMIMKKSGGRTMDLSVTLAIASIMTLGFLIGTMLWNLDTMKK